MQQERHKKILEMLYDNEIVKVSNLVNIFNVSVETIRRDLEFLERQDKLIRVYGGAVLPTSESAEPPYKSRETKNLSAKRIIARRAVELVNDGDVIAVDLGTTTLEFAKALVGKKNVTVITNSLQIAITLTNDPNIKVIVLGGIARLGDLSLSGEMTYRNMEQYNTDKFFLGVGGISIENGISDYHIEESGIRRMAIKNTKNVIALADHSKFNITAMNNICPISALSTVITNSETDKEFLEKLRKNKVEVIIA